jgi:outer membrane immunogenic protein
MRGLVIVSAATAALAGSAWAADLPLKAPAPIAAAYNFSGFYGGVNLGYSVGDNPSTVVATTNTSPVPFQNDSFKMSPHGAVGGAQAGFNWQPSNWLFGVEADIQGSGQSDTVCLIYCRPGVVGYTIENKLTWFGTLRGRFGIVEDQTLFYATGGLAFGGVETNGTMVNGAARPVFTGSVSQTRAGWAAGGGIETALFGNWTGKIEYLHIDLGSQNLVVSDFFADNNVFNTKIRDNIFRLGLNYRVGGTPASVAAANGMLLKAPPARRDWSGVYIGANVGYGLARDPSSYDVTQTNGVNVAHETFDTMPEGVIGGVQLGYNRQFSSMWVAGLEADIQGSGQTDQSCVFVCNGPSNGVPTTGLVEQKLPWFGTLRGRLGFDTGHALVYATGGFAYGRVETNVAQTIVGTNTVVATVGSTAGIQTGWTAGVGIEAPVARNFTVKAEYLYIDLGSQTVAFGSAGVGGNALLATPSITTVTAPLRDNIFRVGVNYRPW